MKASSWTGWIGFAGLLLVIVGTLDFFEGLIAVIRDQYYVLTPSQIIVFDMTTWGWITLIWGLIVGFAGMGLLSRASWARWFTIVVGTISVIAQLAWLGSSQYTIWSLTIVGLCIVALWALMVHWGDAENMA